MNGPVSAEEAFRTLSRWRDEGALLRVRGDFSPIVFDLEGKLASAAAPLFSLNVEDRGTINFLLPSNWNFVYSDGNAASQRDVIGKSSDNKHTYQFGKSLVAHSRNRENHHVLFMQILGKLLEG